MPKKLRSIKMTRKRNNHKLKDNHIKTSIKHYIKKICLVSLLILVVCLGRYYFETDKIYYIPVNAFSAEIKSSNVRVVDGDTIVINNIKVRLQGIDAPEINQKCIEAQNNELYACGEDSKTYLITVINNSEVKCLKKGVDRYKRVLAYCYVGEININKEMVRSGNAIAYKKYDKSFIEDETQARKEKRGIWSGKFEEPEKWRSQNK